MKKEINLKLFLPPGQSIGVLSSPPSNQSESSLSALTQEKSYFQNIRKMSSIDTPPRPVLSTNSHEVHRRPRNTTFVTFPSKTVRYGIEGC
ncbi:hypothetical protein TNCV_867211 [Trichonephila clavipes]|nr:hypothetical protein TNCV_867211 [Trichonephila clavipes]